MLNNIFVYLSLPKTSEGNMNAPAFLKMKKLKLKDVYRWWQAADRDPSGREVLVDVSVYCSVWRGKVRENRMTHTSSASDDSVKNIKL